MPKTITAAMTGNLGGDSYNEDFSTTADITPLIAPTVAAAKVGALTTRTSDTVGTLTMNGGHGILTGDKIDIYWEGGARYNITVGTVATNSVPFTLGSGDVLPADETALVAMVQHVENLVLDGDDVTAIMLSSGSYAQVFIFKDDAGAVIFAVSLPANSSYVWTDQTAITNPLAGEITATLTITHGDSVNPATIKAGIGYN